MPEAPDSSGAAVGALIAQGRAADVHAYGDRHVLRRYRTDHFNLYEAAAMQHVASAGYPVPEVVWTQGRDIVMERLDGTTMLADLEKHPWRLFGHIKILARLINELHAIEPAPWMVRKHATGDAIVHLDLHPDNVMLTSRGPVVIDWSNAGIGDPHTELADLWLILSSAEIPGTGVMVKVLSAGRKVLIAYLLRHFDKDGIRRRLRDAFVLRSRDRNMSEAELGRMRALIEAEAL